MKRMSTPGMNHVADENSPQDVVIFVEGAPVPAGTKVGSTNNNSNGATNSSTSNQNGVSSCRQSGASAQSFPLTAAKNNKLYKTSSVQQGPGLGKLNTLNNNKNGTSDLLKNSLDAYNAKVNTKNTQTEEEFADVSASNLKLRQPKNKNTRELRAHSDASTAAQTVKTEKTQCEDAEEREGMLDISEMKPTPPVLVVMLATFFVLYVSQVFVFDILGSNGIPFRGGGGLDRQAWSLIPEIPNYFAMAMVGFLPCKKTLWQLNRRQVFSAIFVATIDLTAQCLSKTGQVMLNTLTVYIIINSAFSIIFTAVGARCALGKKLNIGQYLGIFIVIGGVVISAFAKQQARLEEESKIQQMNKEEKDAKEAAEQVAEAAFYFGLILVILSTVADGIGFVANEKLMNEGVRSIPGTLLCCIIGIWNSSVLLLWQVFYTFPRWKEVITDPLDYLWSRPDPNHGVDTPIHTYGRADVIFKCVLYIFVSGFFCRVATMYLLKHVGAITFVVIKMLKIGAVAILSVLLGKEEFSVMKTIAASVITFGVGVYSYAKLKAIMGEKASCTSPVADIISSESVNADGSKISISKRKLVNIGDELNRNRGSSTFNRGANTSTFTNSVIIQRNTNSVVLPIGDDMHAQDPTGEDYNDLESNHTDDVAETRPFLNNCETEAAYSADSGNGIDDYSMRTD